MLAGLHERVLSGDVVAAEGVARILLRMTTRLRRRFPRIAHDLAATAVVDAVMEYLRRPSQFDPDRGLPLDRFILHSAARNVLNLRQAEVRRATRESMYSQAVPRSIEYRPFWDEPTLTVLKNLRRRLLQSTPMAERRAVLMWLRGERDVRALSDALGQVSDLPIDQRRQVKRFVDRTRNRAKRLLGEPDVVSTADEVARKESARNISVSG